MFSKPITTAAQARQFVEIIHRHIADFMPVKSDDVEPMPRPFDLEHPIEEGNGVYLQITGSINSPEQDHEKFNTVREGIIAHLGYSAFTFYHSGGVKFPDFDL